MPAASVELSEEQLGQSVEEFMRDQSRQRANSLKRHVQTLIDDFGAKANKARRALRDLANEAVDEDDTACEKVDALCDPFALVAIRGCHAGRIFKLHPIQKQQCWLIGRAEDNNEICLAGDDEVSSSHAKIIFERKQFKLQDSGSTNGTFATNGKGSTVKLKPRKNHVLKIDHLVSFGGSTFKWCYFADAEDVKASTAEIN